MHLYPRQQLITHVETCHQRLPTVELQEHCSILLWHLPHSLMCQGKTFNKQLIISTWLNSKQRVFFLYLHMTATCVHIGSLLRGNYTQMGDCVDAQQRSSLCLLSLSLTSTSIHTRQRLRKKFGSLRESSVWSSFHNEFIAAVWRCTQMLVRVCLLAGVGGVILWHTHSNASTCSPLT